MVILFFRWEGVLTHSLKTYELHNKISEGGEPQFSLKYPHLMLLLTLRRRSLQMVSEMAHDMFEAQESSQALKVANELLVPCMNWFSNSASPQDEGIVENIREKWCQLLNSPSLTDSKLFAYNYIYTLTDNNITLKISIFGHNWFSFTTYSFI